MNNICSVSGYTAKSSIENLAECLNTEYTTEDAEYCCDIPEAYGSGYFKGRQFSHGIFVMEFDVFLHKPLYISFEKDDINPLRLLFNSDSKIRHTSDPTNNQESNTVNKLQRIIFCNGVSTTHSIRFDKRKHINVFIININRKDFEEKIDMFSNDISEELAIIFKDLNGVNHVYEQDYFSLDISKIIEEYKACELEEFMKPVFLEGKTYEILTLQIQSYSDHHKEKHDDKILRRSTIEKIEKAVDIIKDELELRINVHKLAKRVGLNQNTLQSGFQTLFKTSVNDYIRDNRLELAKTLLEKSDLNVTEITYKIGINSRSYFSKLFKERYGISPKEYLTQIRKTKSA